MTTFCIAFQESYLNDGWDEEKSSEAVTDGEGAQRPVLRVNEP